MNEKPWHCFWDLKNIFKSPLLWKNPMKISANAFSIIVVVGGGGGDAIAISDKVMVVVLVSKVPYKLAS